MSHRQQVLDAAALVADRGINQGWYQGDCGELCIMGALDIAFTEGCVSEVLWAVRVGCGLPLDWSTTTAKDIIDWNDAPNRETSEVVGALRRAAELL